MGEERLAALEAECARLVTLGASYSSRTRIVMQDVEGNEFCLDWRRSDAPTRLRGTRLAKGYLLRVPGIAMLTTGATSMFVAFRLTLAKSGPSMSWRTARNSASVRQAETNRNLNRPPLRQ